MQVRVNVSTDEKKNHLNLRKLQVDLPIYSLHVIVKLASTYKLIIHHRAK